MQYGEVQKVGVDLSKTTPQACFPLALWYQVLRRHMSYFADEDSLNGFLQHIGTDNPFFERFATLAATFDVSGNHRQPFETWDCVEPDPRDLVGKMTSMDPARRITAREALQHRWFNQLERELTE